MSKFIIGTGGRPMASLRLLAAASLELAVPQAVTAMHDIPGPARERMAADCAALLACHGDLAWLAVKAHEDDAGLTRLARGLAALAYRPGGVAFLGMAWTAEDSPAGRAAA